MERTQLLKRAAACVVLAATASAGMSGVASAEIPETEVEGQEITDQWPITYIPIRNRLQIEFESVTSNSPPVMCWVRLVGDNGYLKITQVRMKPGASVFSPWRGTYKSPSLKKGVVYSASPWCTDSEPQTEYPTYTFDIDP